MGSNLELAEDLSLDFCIDFFLACLVILGIILTVRGICARFPLDQINHLLLKKYFVIFCKDEIKFLTVNRKNNVFIIQKSQGDKKNFLKPGSIRISFNLPRKLLQSNSIKGPSPSDHWEATHLRASNEAPSLCRSQQWSWI